MSLNDQELKRINELEARLIEIEWNFYIFDLNDVASLIGFFKDENNQKNMMYSQIGRYQSRERQKIFKDVEVWFSKLNYQSLMRIKNTSLIRKELKTRKYDQTFWYKNQIERFEKRKKEIIQKGYSNTFFTFKPNKETYDSELNYINRELIRMSDYVNNPTWEIAFTNRILDVADIYSGEIASIDREINTIKTLAAQRNREMVLAAKMAKAAAADDKVRDEVSGFKLRIKKTELCPYCQSVLGKQPHLDHIYPVSKGGLNLVENLVYCCEVCNRSKSDKSLRQFCKAQGLDYLEVTDRLAELGKHV